VRILGRCRLVQHARLPARTDGSAHEAWAARTSVSVDVEQRRLSALGLIRSLRLWGSQAVSRRSGMLKRSGEPGGPLGLWPTKRTVHLGLSGLFVTCVLVCPDTAHWSSLHSDVRIHVLLIVRAAM
jgi:hypothetical protein